MYHPWNKGKKVPRDIYPTYGNRGKRASPETKAKLSAVRKGKPHWWVVCSKGMLGKHHTPETKERLRKANTGRKRSEVTLTKKRLYRGALASNWKGGITPLGQQIRHLPEYVVWRLAVYKRVGYWCAICSTKKSLEIDHIKPFSVILKEFLAQYSQFSPQEDKETLVRLASTYAPFWELENGRALCTSCNRRRKGKVWVPGSLC